MELIDRTNATLGGAAVNGKRTLFSYVVDHDFGRSPNPTGGYSTLAFCKYRQAHHRRNNVVESAEVGDWIVGTSGLGPLTVGEHGRLVYAMVVTEKMSLRAFLKDPRFARRAGNDLSEAFNRKRVALVSDHFWYFGRNAPFLADRHREYPIEKNGQWHRNNFTEDFIDDFIGWLTEFPRGVNGAPCAVWPHPEPTLLTQGVRRSVCRPIPRKRC